MSKEPSSVRAELWLREQQKKKHALARRILPKAWNTIVAELPDGDDEERTRWLIHREVSHQDDFRPAVYHSTDLSKLTPTQKLDYVHTGELPAPKPKPRGK